MASDKVMTPEFRVSFPVVFEARENQLSKKMEFSIVMMFDKQADLKELKILAQNAAKEKWGDKMPLKLKSPFRNGNTDRADRPEYVDCIFITAKCKNQPGVVNEQVQAIINPRDFYAGCYARATVTVYAYDKMGNQGVAFGLQNVQKLRDGEPLTSQAKAEDEFDAVEVGSKPDTENLGGSDIFDM